jgi:Zn-dependent peptidase ImmA (M78 family)/transcriptional regulator with XRE-family HTH domain
MIDFGKALRIFRDARGLSLRELSTLTEVDHAYIHRLEIADKTAPSAEMIEKLARGLKLSAYKKRLLGLLVAVKMMDDGLFELACTESPDLENIEALARMSFRGAQPNSVSDWKRMLAQLELLTGARVPEMTELTVISRALELQRAAGIDSVPVSIERYLAACNAELRISSDMSDGQAGLVFPWKSKFIISVNGNHSPERRRFTVLHELAHIYLELPSSHSGNTSNEALLRYSSRPREEMLCDVFAAECLLPRSIFLPDSRKQPCCIRSVDELARKYEASVLTTGSRFAACANTMCAWVLAEAGKVRYASVSKPLKDLGFWLDFGIDIPRRSVLGQAHHGESTRTYDEVPAYVWTNKSLPGVDSFCEEIIILPTWSQAVSLIWVDETGARDIDDPSPSEGDELLPELDGHLTFQRRVRRR